MKINQDYYHIGYAFDDICKETWAEDPTDLAYQNSWNFFKNKSKCALFSEELDAMMMCCVQSLGIKRVKEVPDHYWQLEFHPVEGIVIRDYKFTHSMDKNIINSWNFFVNEHDARLANSALISVIGELTR